VKVIIATRIFSPEPAAASFMLEAIARAFVARGDDVEIVTSSLPRGFSELDHAGYRISRAAVRRDSRGYLRGYIPYLSFDIPLFFRLLFRGRPDVYLIEPPPTSGAVMRCIAWLKRRPYYYDAADIWSDAAILTTNNKVVLRLLRAVELFALKGAAKIFTISTGVSDRLRQLGVSREIEVSGFGVDTTAFVSGENAGKKRDYFVYAGTFSEQHGASIFVDAFAEFSLTHPTYTLIFVGNGTERHLLKRRAQLRGLENIEFMNPVAPHELNVLLNGAVASLASLKPGTGYEYAFTTKIYASLASGCPVIYAGPGPTFAFVSGLADTVPAGSAAEYSVPLVVEMMNHTAANRLSHGGRKQLSEWSRARFSIDSVAESIVASIRGGGAS
jgi:glycosyltransferase involved in cell wall biosynthesis